MSDSNVRPFSNGSQFDDWEVKNCEECSKGFDHETMAPATCDISDTLQVAFWDDGNITPEIAGRMAYPGPLVYSWQCGEFDPKERNQ